MQVSLIEKAYELARSQRYANRAEIERALKRQGYRMIDVQATFGKSLRQELQAICKGVIPAVVQKPDVSHRKKSRRA